ncbi:MAG: polysaccharide deacetylase family protein, partial [Magnetospirillum sp.]|nr:polysaccharide deacetylase family protein [Magnetospirillum sp.]
MQLRYLLARPLLAVQRLRGLVSAPVPGLRILLLHDIRPHEMAALDHLVGTLAKSGSLVDGNEAGMILSGEVSPARDSCLITFDDGFASNLQAAENVLARHQAKAVFFVCPGLMALPLQQQRAAIAANIFDGKRSPSDLPADMALMDWSALERLAAQGHMIGNHTMSHRRLTTLSSEQVEAEIAEGAHAIAQNLGRKADWFAFPFGDIDSVNAAVIKAAARHHRFCRSGV